MMLSKLPWEQERGGEAHWAVTWWSAAAVYLATGRWLPDSTGEIDGF